MERAAATAQESDALARLTAPAGTAERVLVVGAHPDDEILGAGVRLGKLPGASVVCVTDGAPRNLEDARRLGFATAAAYAEARRGEWSAALRLAGVPASRARQLAFADQQATKNLVDVTEALRKIVAELRPAIVVTHPYEGGHPDHDATAFAVHVACRHSGSGGPALLEFASYHDSGGAMVTGRFLPAPGFPERRLRLDATDRAHRERLLACFTSQAAMLAPFSREEESFRVAPRHDFLEAPHPGPLLYDRMPWGMSGPEWRAIARSAWAALVR